MVLWSMMVYLEILEIWIILLTTDTLNLKCLVPWAHNQDRWVSAKAEIWDQKQKDSANSGRISESE